MESAPTEESVVVVESAAAESALAESGVVESVVVDASDGDVALFVEEQADRRRQATTLAAVVEDPKRETDLNLIGDSLSVVLFGGVWGWVGALVHERWVYDESKGADEAISCLFFVCHQ